MSDAKHRVVVLGDDITSAKIRAMLSGHDYDVMHSWKTQTQTIQHPQKLSIDEWNRRVADEKAARRREKGKA